MSSRPARALVANGSVMTRLRCSRVAFALGALLLSTCTRTADLGPPAPPLVLEVEYAGCAEVNAGPVCNAAPGTTLVVWASGPPGARLTVRVEGEDLEGTITSTPTALDDGTRWRVTLPRRAQAVVVEGVEGRAAARVSIPLVYEPIPPELAEADRLRFAGQFAEADAVLTAMATGDDVRTQARVLGKRARVAMAMGRTDEAIAQYEAAIALDARAGLLSGEIADRAALAYALIFRVHRLAEADAVIQPLPEIARKVPQSRTAASYFTGLLHREAGSLRRAAAAFSEARVRAGRLGLEQEQRSAIDMEIDVLMTLGQTERARPLVELLSRRAQAIDRPCERAQVLHNLGLYRMNDRVLADPEFTDLREAVRLDRASCPDPVQLAHHTATLARALSLVGRAEEGRRLLAELPADSTRLTSVVLVDAELALVMGQPALAIAKYQQFADATSESLYATWAASIGRARGYSALGNRGRAIEWLIAAEDTLDDYAALVPFGVGRSSFLDTFGDSSRLLLDELLIEGRVEDAWQHARHARRRGLASIAWRVGMESLSAEAQSHKYAVISEHRRQRSALEQEAANDWTLSGQKLARAVRERRRRHARLQADLETALSTLSPSFPVDLVTGTDADEGDLSLLAQESSLGVVLFGAFGKEVAAHRIGTITATASLDELGEQLLRPLAPWLDRAKKVRVLSSGVLDRIDVHALRLDGKALVERLPVVYALDTGRLSAPKIDETHAPVVIVADPRGDLDSAQREASLVSAAAGRSGRVFHLLTKDQASRQALLDELDGSRVALLHIAAHGAFAGIDGWESHVRLAHEDILSIGDILTLDALPARVVMSGCETAREALSIGTSLSLAHAFLLAGAQSVVAASRPIDDTQASMLMADLYGADDFLDLPAALARTQRNMAQQAPKADWASFRVIVH